MLTLGGLMEDSWCVEVIISNGKKLAIGTDFLSGSADLTEADNELIREAGKSLLAFVGQAPNKKLQTDAKCSECGGSLCKATICYKCHIYKEM